MTILYSYRSFLDNGEGSAGLVTKLLGQGYMGIDLFFILSGFVIVYSTQDPEHNNASKFLIRRFFRIVPLAWLTMLACYFLGGAVNTSGDFLACLAFAPPENANPPFHGFKFYGLFWPISYELYFSMVFSVALLFSNRFRTAIASFLLGFSIFAFQFILGGSFTLGAYPATSPVYDLPLFPNQLLPIFGNSILLEFVIGMLFAETYLFARQRNLFRNILVAIPASCLLLSAFLYIYQSNSVVGHGLLGKGLGAICLMLGILAIQVVGDRPKAAPGPLIWLGAVSYPLYLVHGGIVNLFIKQFRLLGIQSVEGNGLFSFLAYCCLALVFAGLCHKFVELPLQARGRRIATSGWGPISATAGLWALGSHGWAQRRAKAAVACLVLASILLGVGYARKFKSVNLLAGDGSYEQTVGRWNGTIPIAAGESVFTAGHSTRLVTSGIQYIESPRITIERGKNYRVDLKASIKSGAIRIQLLGGKEQAPLAEVQRYPTNGWVALTARTANLAGYDFLTVCIDDYHNASDFSIDAVVLRQCP